jgi:hypothetical protein
MDDERERWARAFLWQGTSDLEVYDLLAAQPEKKVPRCHALHYLQMACEKIAKAYRIRDTNAELHGEGGLLRRHVGFEKFMGALLLSPAIKDGYSGRTAQLRALAKTVLAIAREIEKLAPAVAAPASPDNAEYPWASGQVVISPRDHDFSRLTLLREPGGRTFLKLVRMAVERFDAIKIR